MKPYEVSEEEHLKKNIFLVCPIWLPVFFYFSIHNEPKLSVGIDPGMALTPLQSSIGHYWTGIEPTTF